MITSWFLTIRFAASAAKAALYEVRSDQNRDLEAKLRDEISALTSADIGNSRCKNIMGWILPFFALLGSCPLVEVLDRRQVTLER